jgi:hypothetical protein
VGYFFAIITLKGKIMSKKRIVIIGGGTIAHYRNHLAICAPAYGATATQLSWLCQQRFNDVNEENFSYDKIMEVWTYRTRMAGGIDMSTAQKEFRLKYPNGTDAEFFASGFNGTVLETNDDISKLVDNIIVDDTTRIVFFNAALCDWIPTDIQANKYGDRLRTSDYSNIAIHMKPAEKIINKIRAKRKDIFLIGFKTTTRATENEQYLAGLNLCKTASCNLVLANDTVTRMNMIVTPEEARYCVTNDRVTVLKELVDMTWYRSHLNFTRSTVVAGTPILWDADIVPNTLREVVNYCIKQHAYKPFNGVTAGHFACKLTDTTFLTSIRKTNFNDLPKYGLVLVKTDGPDTVLAYGAKPSVGGQSQRIVFHDHPGYDCIVHFHCPLKEGSPVPVVSQRQFECGSHECGKNTSNGLKQFGNLKSVFLDQHGPNIVFPKYYYIEPIILCKF